jgi:hypothetical protein
MGPLGEKWRPPVGKVREWYVVSQHLQGCSPRMRRLRTDELAPVSKYWTYRSHAGVYGPSKPSSRRQQMLEFALIASLVGSREKLGTNPRIGQPTSWGLCRKPFFSGAVTLLNFVDDYLRHCYMWTTWDTYGPGPYVDWAWKACGVLVRFSPTGCTLIRIVATLRYDELLVCGSYHVDNLMAWFIVLYGIMKLTLITCL